MATFQDTWDYTIGGGSTPWYSLLGNTNITNPLLNMTYDDVIRRIDLDPYNILQIDFNANFVSGKDICFIFSFIGMINVQNSPALYWVSDVLTIAGAYYNDATVRTFGNLIGQTITNPSISVSVTINNTNRTMQFTAGGYDSGVVSLLPAVNEKQLVFVGNNKLGIGSDTQAIEIGTINYTPPPLPPTNLVATAISATQIDLLWQDNSSGEEGFSIERKTAGSGFSVITSVPPDTTTYIDDALESDTEYTYRVAAIYPAGNTDYSNEASATTLDQPKWIKAYPEIGGIYDREVDVYLKMDRNTTCYYVILPIESDAPTPRQIIAGTDAFDVKLNINKKGSTLLTGNVEKRITIPYLTQETRYRLYFAANHT